MPDEDVTCTAQWTTNQHNVEWISNGTTVSGPTSTLFGTSVSAVSDPTWTGHTFNGWDCGNTVTLDSNNTFTMPDEDVTCTAQYAPTRCDVPGTYLDSNRCLPCSAAYPHYDNAYNGIEGCYANVTYVPNDGDEDIVNKQYYTAGHPDGYLLNLPNITKTSFVLDGWYRESGFSGNRVSINDVFVGDITLYAKWNFVCESGKWLHVGGNDKLCLYSDKPGVPNLSVMIDNTTYYVILTDDASLPIHEDSDLKWRLMIENRAYNAHDLSVN